MLVLALLVALAGSECVPVPVPLASLSGVFPLRQAAVVRESSQASRLWTVEYASGETLLAVPYAVVVAVYPHPDSLRAVFRTVSETLFLLHPFAGSPRRVSASHRAQADVMLSWESVYFRTDADLICQSSLASEDPTPTCVSALGADAFAVMPMTGLIVYRNATGLFRADTQSALAAGMVSTFIVNSMTGEIAWQMEEDATIFVDGVMGAVAEGQLLTWNGNAIMIQNASALQSWSSETGSQNVLEDDVASWKVVDDHFVFITSNDRVLWASEGGQPAVQLSGLLGMVESDWVLGSDSEGSIVVFRVGENVYRQRLGVVSGPDIFASDAIALLNSRLYKTANFIKTLETASAVVGPSSYDFAESQPDFLPGVVLWSADGAAVSCTVPPTIVGQAVFGPGSVTGSLILNASSTLAGPVSVAGTAVLNGAAARAPSCAAGTLILNATVILGSFSSGVCDDRQCQAELEMNSTHIWVAQEQGCPSSYSWKVFGIIVGVTAFLVALLLLALYLWHRRAVIRAHAKLEAKEEKYRSALLTMEPLVGQD